MLIPDVIGNGMELWKAALLAIGIVTTFTIVSFVLAARKHRMPLGRYVSEWSERGPYSGR